MNATNVYAIELQERNRSLNARVAELEAALEAERTRNVEAWFTEHPLTGRPVMVTPTRRQPHVGGESG